MSPEHALAFVDDIGVKGPRSTYGDQSIPENPKIRRFIWEYAHTLYKCLALMKEAGATASGKKLVLATPQVTIVGYLCDLEGIRPRHGIVSKVTNWPTPRNMTELRGFLGTIGVTRNWIKNFAKIAKPLTELTKTKDSGFEWTSEAQNAMDILKKKATEIVALKKMDIRMAKEASLTSEPGKYNEGRLVLAVDSSMIAVGFILFQVFKSNDQELNPSTTNPIQKSKLVKFPIRYGSITLNEAESKYGQPKIELYGLFRALKALEHLVWGFSVLLEMDASFLKAMINSPGLPNAAATRWITYIQLFNLEFKHVGAESHKAPDGLSRRRRADEDSDDTNASDKSDDHGPFIGNGGWYGIVDPPLEVPVQQEESEDEYVRMTKLRARKGEPSDITKRRKGEGMETLHIAQANPSRSPNNAWNNFMVIAVPGRKKKTKVLDSLASTKVKPELADNNKEDQGHQGNLSLHPHHVLDDERDGYWEDILEYLQKMKIPNSVKNRKSFIQTTRKYFVMENALWRRTNDLPRRVILDKTKREELIQKAHDESGHRGRDPTYKKLSEFYFWPNMLAEIALHCRVCRQCQLRSSYHPKVMINPKWVPTILRKFNLDLVEMGIRSSGFEYIVDMRDDLTGWLEARMLNQKSSETIAKFIWQDVICRFGCIPQITTDNGTEFHGAVDILAKKYGIAIIRTSPYNPAANGMIERGHRTWINSIWKLCGSRKEQWSRWFYHAIWADRVTTRRTTGFSPYYLLYGRPHLFPFNISDETWYTVDWHGIKTTEDLLTVRALQIRKLHMDRQGAANKNARARVQAAKDYATRHAGRLVSGKYAKGELVLVALKGPGIIRGSGLPKSADSWAGPFKVVKRFKSGSYQLGELDGSKIKGSIPAGHLKPFYTKHNPAIFDSASSEAESSDELHPFNHSDDGEGDYQPSN
jgi:hypothetical protein